MKSKPAQYAAQLLDNHGKGGKGKQPHAVPASDESKMMDSLLDSLLSNDSSGVSSEVDDMLLLSMIDKLAEAIQSGKAFKKDGKSSKKN